MQPVVERVNERWKLADRPKSKASFAESFRLSSGEHLWIKMHVLFLALWAGSRPTGARGLELRTTPPAYRSLVSRHPTL